MQDGKHHPQVPAEPFDRLLNSTEENQPAEYQHDKQDNLRPQTLEISWLSRGLRLSLDLIIACLALFYAIFGILVYKSDGTSAAPGSTGLKLLEVSRYAPTIFPVLFAAIVGGGMTSIASWRIQSSQGATVGMVEQCLGSQTITRAITTQLKLRAFNFLGILSIGLWCLSPLGSQASLRVIAVTASTTSSPTSLAALNVTSEYRYGNANAIATGSTKIVNTVIASMMAAPLLANRNQDLWGNIRIPAIERLETERGGATDWITMPRNDNMTYSSLLGMPVKPLPSLGNTSFILPGSYLSISCPVFGLSSQTGYTNYTVPSAPSPNNGHDCRWAGATAGTQYQIAISAPCATGTGSLDTSKSAATRNASRKLVWESYSGRNSYTRAECELTTTFVDAKASCTGSSSGSSSGSECNLSSVRRSINPPFPRDWTVLDLGWQLTVDGMLSTFGRMFPNAGIGGNTEPVIQYILDPYHAVGGGSGGGGDPKATYTIGRSTFELRLGQLLNTLLYAGISPTGITGSFDESQDPALNLTALTTVQKDVIRCNKTWFGLLIFTSLVTFICALVTAFVRTMTTTPDVLGSISVALLDNKLKGLAGSSAWSSSTWARENQDRTIQLRDIAPHGNVGKIALVTSDWGGQVAPVNRHRSYG